eukprot:749139-Hanusia_phi.AAC.1
MKRKKRITLAREGATMGYRKVRLRDLRDGDLMGKDVSLDLVASCALIRKKIGTWQKLRQNAGK